MDGTTPTDSPATAGASAATGAAPLPSLRRDYARPVGRVLAVDGSLVRGLLTTARAPETGAPEMPLGLQIGAIVRIATPRSAVYGVVGTMRVDDPAPNAADSHLRECDIQLLGEAVHSCDGALGRGFQRGVAH